MGISTLIPDAVPTRRWRARLVSSREKIRPMTKPIADVVSSITTRPAAQTLVVVKLVSEMVKDDSEAYEKPVFFMKSMHHREMIAMLH